jgi:tRNA (guanine37-N1)-methyltransferase
VLIDAVARLVPGVVGDSDSLAAESVTGPGLDHPHYTRPAVFRGRAVPDVLLSGNHAAIERWRRMERIRRTRERRPDMYDESRLTDEERRALEARKRVADVSVEE